MKNRRHKKLVKPGIQLGLSGRFLGISVLALLLQALLMTSMVLDAAERMPVGGAYLVDLAPSFFWRTIGLSLLIVLPTTLLVGVLSTFGVVGPIHRIEQFLRAVILGKQVEPCRIRASDSLHGLVDLINEATEPLRERRDEPEATGDPSPPSSGARAA